MSKALEHAGKKDPSPNAIPKPLLPSPLASLVSFVTAASSLSLRVGGFIGHTAINAGRVGTLSGVELGRAVLESVLFRAGQDVVELSTGRLGKVAAEGILESASSFLISAGFRLGSSSLSAGLGLSSALLSTINAVLGDTETSKAIATIIVLIRREIRTPDTGVERVNFGDALAGSIGFVLLQRWGWERTEKALAESGAVETVWDVVILDQGDTLVEQPTPLIDDVSSRPRPRGGQLSHQNRPSSFISTAGENILGDLSPTNDGMSVLSIDSNLPTGSPLDAFHPEDAFKDQLSQQLRAGSSVRIATQSVLKNTVAVEIEGQGDCNIEPPAGYTLIAVQSPEGQHDRKHKFIFRNTGKRTRRGNFDVEVPPTEDDMLSTPTTTTPVDGQGQVPLLMSSADGESTKQWPATANPLSRDWQNDTSQPAPIKANDSRPRSPPLYRTERSHSVSGYFESREFNDITEAPTPTDDYGESLSKRNAFKRNIKRGTSYGKLVEFWNSSPRKRSKKPVPDRGPPRTAGIDTDTYWLSTPARAPSPIVGRSPWPSGASTPRQSLETRPSVESDLRAEPNSHFHQKFHHKRKPSSVFSLKTNMSETSLVLRPENQKPTREKIAQTLERSNTLPGQYPINSFTSNVARFARFSLAAYGSTFIRFTGAATDSRKSAEKEGAPLDRHQSFQNYTGLPESTILVSSYVDPEGGAHMEGHADSGMPLIHYISLDHDSKAVVLTCRGTLGFEDVLIDMTCDYDTFLWRGKPHQVHKGMLASARRLLTLHSGRIVATIKAALEEFDDYGLILCGHSLGGSVCSILGMMISQPNPDFHTDSVDCPAFLTAQPPNGPSLIAGSSSYTSFPPHPADALAHTLPANRPVHVYAYGPAATVSPALSLATRGLITTIINHADVVPYLSLGNLRDFQSIALAFKHDTRDAKGEMRKRVWDSLRRSIRNRSGLGNVESFFTRDWSASDQGKVADTEWPWVALEALRTGLTASKLLPPGECFIVERKAVLQRFAFTEAAPSFPAGSQVNSMQQAKSFKPASHIRVIHVKDVARRFVELRFQSSMFLDHMPSRYEKILEALEGGVA
ncbi:MAG: hypothetical protein Q9162_004392 [Coniocarpon cinnabarinum]